MDTVSCSLNSDIGEALRKVPLFAELHHERLECLQWISDGDEIFLQAGERVVHEGDVPSFFVVLEGDLHVLKKTGDAEMLVATHHPGSFFGEVPLLLGTGFIASGQAVEEARVFRLKEESFWQMLSTCPTVTRTVLQTMASRVKNLEAVAQGHEKLVSLGTMAAGLAHELNNPAAATRRAAKNLDETARALPAYSCRLNKQQLSGEQSEFLTQLQREVAAQIRTGPMLDPLVQSAREDEITEWLEARDVPESWKLAPDIVEAGLDTTWLDRLAEQIPARALQAVLTWLVATLTLGSLIGQIDQSTSRIVDLVKAVKSYSHLDQAPLQEVDIHAGLEDTLTLLGHKLKGIDISRDYDRSLPRLMAYSGELNQVWTNLIDNAVDATKTNGKETGKLRIHTTREGNYLIVEIGDNGEGIPPEIKDRIFEPFFTTKGVGQGTGLGLVISHRIIVGLHHGDISIQSQPGDTRFQVRLPLDNTHGPSLNNGMVREPITTI